MAPEYDRVYIPPNNVAEFEAFIAQIPGARRGVETSSVDRDVVLDSLRELSQTVDQNICLKEFLHSSEVKRIIKPLPSGEKATLTRALNGLLRGYDLITIDKARDHTWIKEDFIGAKTIGDGALSTINRIFYNPRANQ